MPGYRVKGENLPKTVYIREGFEKACCEASWDYLDNAKMVCRALASNGTSAYVVNSSDRVLFRNTLNKHDMRKKHES